MEKLLLAAVSFFAAAAVVIIFVALGWYLLWVLILSRFKFIKDLLNSARGLNNPPQGDQAKTSRTKLKKTRKD